MLHSIFVGLCMAVVTIAIHAGGTTFWINYLRNRARAGRRADTWISRLQILCTTAIALLTIHIVEVVVWGLLYLLLVGGRAFETVEQAIYFSTVTFASLGYGDVVIGGSWRMLSAIQSMVGLLVFGWSSALLFAVVQRMLNVEMDLTPEDKKPPQAKKRRRK